MREILFRGKDKDGNWVEGDLIHDYIAIETVDDTIYDWPDPIPVSIKQKDCFPVEVVQETVGQFTGLTDKNGVKIFEGDIYKDSWGKLSVVEFFYADEHKTSGHGSSDRIIIVGLKLDFVPKHIEVIGNIHYNPEILNQ